MRLEHRDDEADDLITKTSEAAYRAEVELQGIFDSYYFESTIRDRVDLFSHSGFVEIAL